MRRAIDYIRAGDVFQVNLSRRLGAGWAGDPFALYARLRRQSPAPFAALVRLAGRTSSRPRRSGSCAAAATVRDAADQGHAPARPTRADDAPARELRASAKDRAENVMIVDLARNDLGRVARYGTVEVTALCEVERHPGVHHLASTSRPVLRPDVSVERLVRATFPPGSVTGAPKIRAIELIEELEPVRRGPYCGAIGCFGPGGASSCRSRSGPSWPSRRLHLHAGGAVVADSDPAMEWAETSTRRPACWRRPVGSVREREAGRARLLKVWLDGRLIDEEAARVSADDHGFLLGDGVFETLRSYGGVPFAVAEHLARLARAPRCSGIAVPAGRGARRARCLRRTASATRACGTLSPAARGRPASRAGAARPPRWSPPCRSPVAADRHGDRVAPPPRRAQPARGGEDDAWPRP